MTKISGDPLQGRRELEWWLERYRGCYERNRIPLGAGWAEPYVARMAELMREVEVRRQTRMA
jgi:hypothetical protein